MAATDANGFPANVVTNTLIESAWGNAVRKKMLDFATSNAAAVATSVRFGTAVYGTNGNGDALITFAPAFPSALLALIAMDATQGIDQAFICKLMNAASTPATGVVRVYLHDGTKVASNGSVVLSWIAYGR